jgi:protein transport protein SEC39
MVMTMLTTNRVATFSPYFPNSPQLGRLSALLAATHSLSFYSLTLQHGVPFQPVSIRVSQDPVGLLEKVLAQNPRSYTKLDDLISMGRSLVAARPDQSKHDQALGEDDPAALSRRQLAAERRIIGMAIQSALAEDDFETAYSYVVNRLNIQPGVADPQPSPSSAVADPTMADDPSWRAALAAGRYRPPPSSNTSNSASQLRTLHQRMDLLQHALLLAPPPTLPEILTAYRRCEEELLAALAAEDEADARYDAATAGDSTLPGAWGGDSGIRLPQQRREVGRAVGRAGEEAPVGLFDVARGAAEAFRRNAFAGGKEGGRGAGVRMGGPPHARSESQSEWAEGEERVRKRDMVANAVTGGLASGIGWVLGATPVHQQQQMEHE